MSRSIEAAGGVGFGNDYYPSSYDHHTEISYFSNGASSYAKDDLFGPGAPGMAEDPYLPIENEPMGSNYSPYNFDGSGPADRKYPYGNARAVEAFLAKRKKEKKTRTAGSPTEEFCPCGRYYYNCPRHRYYYGENMRESPDPYPTRGMGFAENLSNAFEDITSNTTVFFMFLIILFVLVITYIENCKLHTMLETMQRTMMMSSEKR